MGDREFREKFLLAQKGNEQVLEETFKQFELLLYKNSYINGRFDNDCFQELSVLLTKCIKRFKFNNGIGNALFLKLLKEHHSEK
jgi:hypothetical protein